MTKSLGLSVVVLASVLATGGSGQQRASRGVEILWDTWGIPHVFASDEVGAIYGFGWAQMGNHADLVLRLYAEARGRGAEYFGEERLETDRWVRLNGAPALGKVWLDAQRPSTRKLLESFVEGMNDYARANPERIDSVARRVLPIVPADVLAHLIRVFGFNFIANPRAIRDNAAQWQARAAEQGSNAWAIAPARSASGHALLLANPHLAWADHNTYVEAQLNAPGVNVYGATLVGMPFIGIAFNDHLGWTRTVNNHDGADLFELSLRGEGYEWDGQTKPFERETQTIKVRQRDGSFREDRLEIRRSIHGPVVGTQNGKALALRITGLDQPHMIEQYWAMARARNLEQFKRAIAALQIPKNTLMYADRDGHIMHFFSAQVPVRPAGDWNWTGVVPGNTSRTLWTRTHGFRELPLAQDPRSGWLQNANEPPWWTTFPTVLHPADFPRYMSTRPMSFRAQRSARMLAEDSSITYDELIKYKLSTRMELADRLLDDLVPAARASGRPVAERAARVLEQWDRTADAGRRGGTLFEAFVRELGRRYSPLDKAFAKPWDAGAPRVTPDGLADLVVAVEALERAAAEVERDFGALDVAWGDAHRVIRDGVDLPASGADGALGVFRVVNYSRPAGERRYRVVGGDSYIAAIEFSDPVRAMALLNYGNASQPGSPHRTDQLPLFSEKRLRPVWRTRAELERHLEQRERL
jgi:acyl-homoserine-lactone acylase